MARLSPDDRRQAIVDATLAVARRQGLGATTVRDVAAEMGTSSGLIHHYFESMDDVLAAAFEQAAGGDLGPRPPTASRPKPIPSPNSIMFIESYAPAQSDWTMQLWLDAWAEAARRPALQHVSRRLNREWQSLVRTDRRRRCRDIGESSRPTTPTRRLERLLSVLDGLALQVVAHAALITRDEVVAWSRSAAEHELGLGSRSG